MIEITKAEIQSVMLTISAYDVKANKLVYGLLKENLSLATKRALQKINKELVKHYNDLVQDTNSVKNECKDDPEKLKKELETLYSEPIKIDLNKVKLSEIESITTSDNYDFDIIEKIAT